MKLATVLSQEPRMVRRIKDFCLAIPDGDVVTSQEVAAGLEVTTIRTWAAHPALRPYRIALARQVWWGNPKTIKKA